MGIFLALETTTRNCSVALFDNEKLIKLKEKVSKEYSHAEQLTLFIEDVLKRSDISLQELDGIALSSGPGSYTGLRIGTSTAKGLCYSLDIPLVSVSTLKAMAYGMSKKRDFQIYCPMIDARRMEVFASFYDKSNNEIRGTQADIIEEHIYDNFLKEKILFFGDGSLKCKNIIVNPNAYFIDNIFPSAKDIGALAYNKFLDNDHEDVAYFEPYYLKDFIAGVKTKF
tara:strand:- start:55 stop:732 length:678 start_codon:yes stop_codon:yes gene_type:complete